MIAQIALLNLIHLLVEDDWVQIDDAEADLLVVGPTLIPDCNFKSSSVGNPIAVYEPRELLIESWGFVSVGEGLGFLNGSAEF